MLSRAVTENLRQLVRLDAGDPADVSHAFGGASGGRLFGLDAEALAALMAQAGQPAWRGRQLAEAMYRQRVADLNEITTLPKSLRQRLIDEGWQVGRPQIAQVFQSVDGTERYLVQCPGQDTETVEAVWMPEGDDGENGDGSDLDGNDLDLKDRAGKRWDRATICVSSQVGCAVNCQFCLTAKLGLQRNLTAGEIAGQVIAIFARHGVEVGRDRVNLVFMGMGEPFLNYDNFMGAARLLVEEVGLSPQRMTVSTSGIVPGIERFAQEPAEVRPKLAISLNAPNAGRSDRSTAARGRSGAAGAPHRIAGEGEPDCLESGPWHRLLDASARGRGSLSRHACRGGNSHLCAQAAGTGYLCGLRAVEADGGGVEQN